MSRKSTQDHEARIQGVFRRAYVDGGWSAAHDTTPLDVLLAEEYDAEELDAVHGAGDVYYWPAEAVGAEQIELRHLKHEEANAVASWARRRLVRWIIGEGLHPLTVVKRVYQLLYAAYQEFIGPLNMTTLAEMLDEGKAAFSARMQRLFSREVKLKTGHDLVSHGMKSAKSKAAYAENARRNRPRGKHDAVHLDEGVEAMAAKESLKEQQQRLRKARLDYERERMAKMVGCDPSEIDLSKINLNDENDHE